MQGIFGIGALFVATILLQFVRAVLHADFKSAVDTTSRLVRLDALDDPTPGDLREKERKEEELEKKVSSAVRKITLALMGYLIAGLTAGVFFML